MGYSEYVNVFEGRVQKYLPAGPEWTPADKAVYGPKDLFRVPTDEADALRFDAVKYQFTRHYEQNSMYRGFCQDSKVSPEDIRSLADLSKVPLIQSEFFKSHPTGRDFATWLGNIYTGELPQVKISGKEPTYDQVIEAFNAAGLVTTYSSGTGGRHTFVPRDRRSFNVNEYAMAKNVISMFYPKWNPGMHGYLLLPNPFKTNLFAGRLATIYYDIMKDVECAVDRVIDTELIKLTMSDDKSMKSRLVKKISSRAHNKSVGDIISWIEKRERSKEEMAFCGAPFILYSVIERLKEEGRRFDIGERGLVLTGGGWKVHELKRMPEAEFRKDIKEYLGIPPENVIDMYGMVEGNGWIVQCPEGHHLHIPTTYIHPMVLDDNFNPLGYGEPGRFAFLDGSMYSYPGFIITGDRVKMLERCPVCGRPGPVLEPGVTRAAGKESRGCAEEVRKVMSSDMGG
jgi:phenylacetate-coenzyme A ligase PaaK-like adenylate-forming protein